MMPIRFCSGVQVSREQHHHFWDWRHWAERVGVPRGDIRWEIYAEDCVRWFGGVPTMPPQLEPPEENASDGRDVGQGVGGQGGVA
jgi:hypothetical protein